MKYLLAFILTILFSGCTQKYFVSQTETDLGDVVISTANQLFVNNLFSEENRKLRNKKIVVTSFVDLSQLNKTTTFGRALGESMINELHIRGFAITDFRGQEAIVVNANGEFHLTRDIAKLRPVVKDSYILVSTYAPFDKDRVSINARIIDFDTGEVLSTARTIYKYNNCEFFDLCKKEKDEMELKIKLEENSSDIKLITDGCSKVNCPNN